MRRRAQGPARRRPGNASGSAWRTTRGVKLAVVIRTILPQARQRPAPRVQATSSRYACQVAWPMTGMVTTSPTNAVAKPTAGQQHDEDPPNDHRRHVRRECAQAGQRGDDAVGVAVQHHRHRHHADREHQQREEAADAEIGEEKFGMLQRQHLREKTAQVRHVVGEEQREDHQRRARPDQQDDAEQHGEHADGADVGPPGVERRRKPGGLALLPPPRKVIESDRQERADQEKPGDQRRHVLVRVAEHEIDQESHHGEARAVERARQRMRAEVAPAGGEPPQRAP